MRIRTSQRKHKGQTIVLIAFALVALIALVALAVDGSNAYNQRRIAQNSVDGATTAGMTQLYKIFIQNRLTGDPAHGVLGPITPSQNASVRNAILGALRSSGYGDADTDPNRYGIDTRATSAGGDQMETRLEAMEPQVCH